MNRISIESLWQKATPVMVTVFFCVLVLWLTNWLLCRRNQNQEHEHAFPRQLLMLLLILAPVIVLIISGLLAFSSTTMFSNVVAGTMMRFTRPFFTGDFIRINEYAGRVTDRSFFDCKVQTEKCELNAIPNNYFINHPVGVVRSSGAILSASLSLGYNVHHGGVES